LNATPFFHPIKGTKDFFYVIQMLRITSKPYKGFLAAFPYFDLNITMFLYLVMDSSIISLYIASEDIYETLKFHTNPFDNLVKGESEFIGLIKGGNKTNYPFYRKNIGFILYWIDNYIICSK
jgi:hypothetical protein